VFLACMKGAIRSLPLPKWSVGAVNARSPSVGSSLAAAVLLVRRAYRLRAGRRALRCSVVGRQAGWTS